MDSFTWTTEKRKTKDLVPADYNPRQISERQAKELEKSIRKFNLVEIPAIDTDGTILAGHQRISMLLKMGRGEEEIDVRVPNRKLTDREAKEYNLRSNKNTGEWDADKLFALPADLLKDVGFSNAELDLLLGAKQPSKEDDYDPTDVLVAPAKAQLGDLYELGAHRLLCGDSTAPASYSRLLGEDKPVMMFTDPPYGVSYVGKTKDALKIDNDSFDEEGTRKLWLSAYSEARSFLKDGGSVYVSCPSGPLHLMFAKVLSDCGDLRQVMVWIKDKFVLGHSDYHYKHEPLLYGWKSTGAHAFYASRDRDSVWEQLGSVKTEKDGEFTVIKFQGFKVYVKGEIEMGYVKRNAQKVDIWRFDKPSRSAEHPTMKPVELVEEAVKNSSQTDDLVLDPFAGSGTTLIACENLGRKARVIELDPKYVDVIIDRWEKLTGNKAVKTS